MNPVEYRQALAAIGRLESGAYCGHWHARYSVLALNLAYYARHAQTEAGKQRCKDAIDRFDRIAEKMLTGWRIAA